MNCKVCNHNNPDDAQFCANCGKRIESDFEAIYGNTPSSASASSTTSSSSTSYRVPSGIFAPKQSTWIHFRAIAFVIGIQFVLAFFVASAPSSDDKNPLDNMMLNLVFMFLMQMCFLGAVLASGTQRVKLIKRRFYISPKLLLISLAMWAVAFIAFLSTNVYFGAWLQHIGYKSSELDMNTAAEIIVGIFVIGIIAPICEELVFRFGVLEGFRDKGFIKAVLISALAFALMHMNPEQTFYQFLLGAVCAVAAYKSNSILPAMIIHSANNLFSFATMGWDGFNNGLETMFNQGWFVIIAIILFVAGIYAILKLGKLCQKYGNPNSKLPPNIHPILSSYQIARDKTTTITLYCITLGICTLFWILQFATAMGMGI